MLMSDAVSSVSDNNISDAEEEGTENAESTEDIVLHLESIEETLSLVQGSTSVIESKLSDGIILMCVLVGVLAGILLARIVKGFTS